MVCVHCGQKTQVSNSRLQRRANQVWRRRACLNCGAVFTTLESTDYGAAWLVKGLTGALAPFSRDKLFLSLYASCQHRPTAITDAGALSDTLIAKLLPQVQGGVVTTQAIAAAAQVALSRFDAAAAVHYQAFHVAH
jgi:transcriptional repressor NrdR